MRSPRYLLIRFLQWCLRVLKYEPVDPFRLMLQKYRPIARRLEKLADEKYPVPDEEAMRHWVFVRMCVAFPEAKHRDLNLTIELVIRERVKNKQGESIWRS